MFKIIVGSFIGCFFAVLSLWLIQQQYIMYKLEKVEANLVLSEHKNDEYEKELATAIENTKIERSAKLCLNEASRHHKATAELKNIARRGTGFVAINYFINKEVFHAQCYIAANKIKSFKVID
jgi:hypothetical protein